MKTLNVILLLCLVGLSTPTFAQEVYDQNSIRQPMNVEMGTIVAIRRVIVEGNRSYVGAGAGAAVGGVVGNATGQRQGPTTQSIATVLGVIAGGLVGDRVEQNVKRDEALELTIKKDSGQLIAIVQPYNGENFAVDERVRLLTNGYGGPVRVSR